MRGPTIPKFAFSTKSRFALAGVAVLVITGLTAGMLFAASEPEQPDVAVQTTPSEPAPQQVAITPDDIQKQMDLPPIAPEPATYPNLDSHLNRLAESSEALQNPSTTDGQADNQSDDPVLVTFYIEPGKVDDVRQYLEDNGIYVRNVGEDYIEAHVPPDLLGVASEQPGVLRVNAVIPPRAAQSQTRVITQGVGLHGADAWHNAGYRGNGVRVGVIDTGFEGFRRLQGSELPANATARCYFETARAPSSQIADCEAGGGHGTAVAETLFDMAPGAQIYIANPHTPGDLRNATDWMASQGVTVINLSVGYPPLGPGDGTSPFSDSPLLTIDAAVSQRITWVQAAGNSAGRVWFGTYTDPDGEGIHHWTDEDVGNAFIVQEGERPQIFMRWEDSWGTADCNLDLEMFGARRGIDGKYPVVDFDHTVQDGQAGSYPFAFVSFAEPVSAADEGLYFVVIRNRGCTVSPAWIQLTAWIDSPRLQYRSARHHMGVPEETRNPGALSVGATDYYDTAVIASYSSRGPTIDGRTKPDITGVACAESSVYSPSAWDSRCWFRGTSQSSPHVAGMATLVKQRFPQYQPQQVTDYLKEHTSERGPAGADNIWGYGLATLPDPTRAQPPATVPGLNEPRHQHDGRQRQ